MDRYPEGASSKIARVNIFQLTSIVSDYKEKLFGRVKLDNILLTYVQDNFNQKTAQSRDQTLVTVA